jgi:hypothetical protein
MKGEGITLVGEAAHSTSHNTNKGREKIFSGKINACL